MRDFQIVIFLIATFKNDCFGNSQTTDNTTEFFTEIPFKTRTGTIEALSVTLSFPELKFVTNHGCWCSNLRKSKRSDDFFVGYLSEFNSDSSHKFGAPIDELDTICKNWIKDRRCIGLFNGVCYEAESQFYTLKLEQVENGSFVRDVDYCVQNEDPCESTNCLIDVFYVNLIKDEISNLDILNSEISVLNPVCDHRNVISAGA